MSTLAHIHRAFDAFLLVWAERGGYRYRGRLKDDDASFAGPWIWSEADVVYRFSEFLEAEFPRTWIHTEFEVSPLSRHAIEPGESAAVDLVVVDTDDFVPDATSRVRFWPGRALRADRGQVVPARLLG
jgi:hypothetical protein